MLEPFLFTRSECGTEFEPDPDCICEGGFDVIPVDESVDDYDIDASDLRDASDEELFDMGITNEQRDALLRGESINTSVIVCKICQNNAE